MTPDTAAALAYLKNEMGEGWTVEVFYGNREWLACAYRPRPASHGVRVSGFGPDPMSAARACVEAWREATIALRENLEFRENDLAVSRARENAEREHADRLAEALREARNRLAEVSGRIGDAAENAIVYADAANEALAAHDARRSGGEGVA